MAELLRMKEIRKGRGIMDTVHKQLILQWTKEHLVVVMDYLVFVY